MAKYRLICVGARSLDKLEMTVESFVVIPSAVEESHIEENECLVLMSI